MDISAPRSPPASGRLACCKCSVALPLREARPGEVPFDWQCVACGAITPGLLVLQSDQEIRRRVQLHTFRPHQRTSLALPAKLQASATSSSPAAQSGSRRLAVPVPAIGLDDCLHPSSSIVVMLSQEISTSSISLLHVAPWTSPLVAVQLPNHSPLPLQLVVCVDACAQVGDVWLLRGRFTQRLATR